jgi:hypothetical protein
MQGVAPMGPCSPGGGTLRATWGYPLTKLQHLPQYACELAGPGEVLVSRTVTDLVAGSGIGFEDRGEHELKGVPGSWKLFAVRT